MELRSRYGYTGTGSVAQLTDRAGNLQTLYRYDPSGNVKISEAVDTGNPCQYNGEYTDAATRNAYLRARYYDAGTGSFLTEGSYLGSLLEPVPLCRKQPGELCGLQRSRDCKLGKSKTRQRQKSSDQCGHQGEALGRQYSQQGKNRGEQCCEQSEDHSKQRLQQSQNHNKQHVHQSENHGKQCVQQSKDLGPKHQGIAAQLGLIQAERSRQHPELLGRLRGEDRKTLLHNGKPR